MQDAQDLKRLAADLAVFAQHLQDQSERAVQHVDRSAEELHRAAQGMGADAQQLAQQIVNAVQAQAQEAVGRGAELAFGAIGTQLRDSAEVATRAAQALDEQRKKIERAQQNLIYKSAVALLIGSLLAVGGSWYFARKSLRLIERAEFGAEILDATKAGTLTRCDGKLCARAGKRFGAKGEYVLIE